MFYHVLISKLRFCLIFQGKEFGGLVLYCTSRFSTDMHIFFFQGLSINLTITNIAVTAVKRGVELYGRSGS